MRGIYSILFTVSFVLSAPYYFGKMWRRGHWRPGFRQRFGRYSAKTKQALTNRHVLWMHAVSVGEVNICTQLIRALEPRVPNIKIVVSTTTSTGMGELRKKLPSHIEKIYYPIDRQKWVNRALTTIHPEAIVLVEAEIWPNFLWRAQEKNIPLFLVNARLSQRSYRGYRLFSWLFKPIFRSFAGVGVQNGIDAEKMKGLGCRAESIHILGNLKFDSEKVDERRLLDVGSLLRQLGVAGNAPVLVCGSTHAGEEELLAERFLRLRRRFPDLFLVIVPRHFERGREVGKELGTKGIKFVYRNTINPGVQFKAAEVECLLVNTTGELKHFYEHATVVFVGKSLVTPGGGQNPVEPGALGKAMLFGPNMQNFQAISAALVERKGAMQVQNADELENAVGDLLENQSLRMELGRNALKVVQENQGAVERTVEMIVKYLPADEIFIQSTP